MNESPASVVSYRVHVGECLDAVPCCVGGRLRPRSVGLLSLKNDYSSDFRLKFHRLALFLGMDGRSRLFCGMCDFHHFLPLIF
jgi:hypothetical protein